MRRSGAEAPRGALVVPTGRASRRAGGGVMVKHVALRVVVRCRGRGKRRERYEV